MPNCTNCSAPLQVNSISCDYCGSRNDVDLRGVHYYTSHELNRERICPVCSVHLRTVDLGIEGKFFIERCPDCLGLFFDPGELEALLESTVRNVFEINRSRLAQFNLTGQTTGRAATYVKCPVCSKIMNRTNFGIRSGVVIDSCKEHGVWLDAGELRQLSEWMKAGGRLLDNERVAERKKEALLEKNKRQKSMQGGTTADYETTGPSDFKIKPEPDLLDIVLEAIRFLKRL